ncbi:tryptophan 7-halogenase [Streptomyces sp. NL15-2K]|uniref:tryptophan 7-halogenase n=1 Tax=Streptomyces sp. NL15-2K TaxID=376149 RepID=UPI000F57E014|nr:MULTISPECIES: tryptophan 7-halogenase [Actinomycetes]WKX12779.1 tryptophan 7-halogenase [Kutzneria buriramensis]GCB53355.1 tryptophan halogenase [Streptomyces sp. NL15-2K]
MESSIKKIVVVGGSVVGWTVAARLAQAFGGTVLVTVLQAPSDLADGVETGQVTAVPPELQRVLFDQLGVAESVWMRSCRASFRAAVRHVNWRTPGAAGATARTLPNGGADHFYRPYADMPECEKYPLSDYWQSRRSQGETVEPYDYACFREPPLMDARKSPRWLDGRAALPYGWHVDTRLFTEFVRDLAVRRLGVRVFRDRLRYAARDADGMISVLHTEQGRTIPGDFFLDCTGKEGLLLNRTLGEPFHPAHDRLLCDSTVTVTVPHDDDTHGIEPFATATAMPYGWTWKMPLPGRFVTGLVYARALTGPDEAARALCELWGLPPARTEVRRTSHRFGRSHRSWVGNCVAAGASACSVEPLGGDGLTEALDTIDRLVRDFPSRDARDAPAARFNRAVEARQTRALDVAQLHYAAAPRTDPGFWRAQRELPLSAALQECVQAFSAGLSAGPGEDVHYGLLAALHTGCPAPRVSIGHRPGARRAAGEHFTRVKRQQRILLETLPSAHAYLRRLHRDAVA